MQDRHNSRPAGRRDRRHQRRAAQAGMALATMLFLVATLAIVAASVSLLIRNTLQSTQRRMERTQCLNIAESGVDLALAWLQSQPSPPADSDLHPIQSFFGTAGAANGVTLSAPFGNAGSTLRIVLYSDANNSSDTQKKYLCQAQARMASGMTTTVQAYLQQNSFGQYAFFADRDSAGFWDYHNHFEGRFHSNDADDKPDTFLWKNPSPEAPMFQFDGPGAFESRIPPRWWKDTTGNVKSPSTASDYAAIATAGLAGMNFNADNIPMPQTDYLQMYAALGQTPPYSSTGTVTAPPSSLPTQTGVTVSPGGGIYIHGDVTSMTLSSPAAGTQVFTVVTKPNGNTLTQTVTVTPTGATTTSTLKSSSGTTLTPPTVAPVTGKLNGMVYADGNIASLSGTIGDNQTDSDGAITYRNQWTLATSTSSSSKISITNPIVYNTPRTDMSKPQSEDKKFNTSAGTLGILTSDLVLADSAPANVEVDALIYATDTYKANNYKIKKGTGATMTNIGGVIVKEAGLFATADSNGNLTAGWQEKYHYDIRMADNPPPFFPTTGNHYSMVSYQLVRDTLM